jgi:hypothetical protein
LRARIDANEQIIEKKDIETAASSSGNDKYCGAVRNEGLSD